MAVTTKNVILKFTGKVSGVSSIKKMNSVLQTTAKSFSGLTRAASSSNNTMAHGNKTLLSSANAYKGLVGQVTNLNKFVNIFGASIRQLGQGLQNFGTTVTAFISLPVGLVMRGWTKVVFSLDDSLIAIRRSAGLSAEELDRVRKGLVEMSKTTPTPLEDLAAIGEDVAKSGADSSGAILAFVDVIDKLTVATDLLPAESSKALLKVIKIGRAHV